MESHEDESWPREEEAREYMAKHKILELFHNFTSQLIYNQPAQPKEFLVEVVDSLLKARSTKGVECPSLLDDSNIQVMFGMLDPTGRRFITTQQYREALQTMGITDFDQSPLGSEADKISLEIFTREAKRGLAHTNATYLVKRAGEK